MHAQSKPPAAVVTHGGAGGPKEHSDACEVAARVALDTLGEGETSLEAVIRATMSLEDDPRLNAGTGSNFRLDGKTIEMDAAVMDHTAKFGAVAALQRVQYPVRVAEMVYESPHLLVVGEGASALARLRGVPDYDPSSTRALKRYAEVQAFFAGYNDDPDFGSWGDRDPARFWNLPADMKASLKAIAGPSDTVGAVARDAEGRCAAALSTGGTSIMMLGRVGDTPILGAGLFAGPHGAVAATGDGEEILRRVLAKQVYDWIAAGTPAQEAVERGVAEIPDQFTVGLIAISATDEGIADNRTMPAAILRGN
jgi:L-asparaginase/beta-aspartyl-peptidase (threonine type)